MRRDILGMGYKGRGKEMGQPPWCFSGSWKDKAQNS